VSFKVPENEAERLQRLRDYEVLDSFEEEDFDNITKLAASICKTPISLVSLIDEDRQWFKSQFGLKVRETPRQDSFCSHAILEPEKLFVVKDAKKDKRFAKNPLVNGYPKIVFYTGVPLVDEEGYPLGTLCIIDNKPRSLTKEQQNQLKILSRQAMKLLELRYKNRRLSELADQLDEKNEELHQFAVTLSHDIKSPITGIQMLAQLIHEKAGHLFDDKNKEYLEVLENTIKGLQTIVSEVLSYYQLSENKKEEAEFFEPVSFVTEIAHLVLGEDSPIVKVKSNAKKVKAKAVSLKLILVNLIHNAYRYNDNPELNIAVTFYKRAKKLTVSVSDNGKGISKKDQKKLTLLFGKLQGKDRFGRSSYGFGLAKVKKLLEQEDSKLQIKSSLGKGSSFSFTLPC
jgi:signal transduction histidine kinase